MFCSEVESLIQELPDQDREKAVSYVEKMLSLVEPGESGELSKAKIQTEVLEALMYFKG